jgi:3-hydroxyacyl-CoA dehydrogenase
MYHADQLTPVVILAQIAALAKTDPLSWSVPELLQRLVQEGRSFDSLNREGSSQ